MSESRIQMVVTGPAWMGSGIGSIEATMERLFREVQDEMALTAFSISSAADLLFDGLERALDRGVSVRMAVNRVIGQPPEVVGILRRLVRQYPHFTLYDFAPDQAQDLHAKVLAVDRQKALIGSSNLSRRGLLFNYEFAVYVEGPAAAAAAQVLDRLFVSKEVERIRT